MNEVVTLSVKHFREELALLARILYKVKNQQRRMQSYKHLQAIKRFGNKLIVS